QLPIAGGCIRYPIWFCGGVACIYPCQPWCLLAVGNSILQEVWENWFRYAQPQRWCAESLVLPAMDANIGCVLAVVSKEALPLWTLHPRRPEPREQGLRALARNSCPRA